MIHLIMFCLFVVGIIYGILGNPEGLGLAMIAGIIDPEVLGDIIQDKLANKFANISDLDTSSEFSVGTPGTSWEIPINDLITAFTRDGEDVTLIPQNLTQDRYKMVVQRAGQAYREQRIDDLITGDIKKSTLKLAERITERAIEYILQSRFWILEGAIPAVNRRGALGTNLTAAEIGQGKFLLGDKSTDLKYILMHSKTFEDLSNAGVIVWQTMVNIVDAAGYTSQINLGDVPPANKVPTVRGLICVVSDYCTIVTGTPTQYVSYLLSPLAMGMYYQKNLTIEEDKEILVDGGYKFYVPRIDYCLCLHGMNYAEATSPQLYTQAALQNIANYTMIFASAKNIGAVRLLHL
jgi:hypothetical protein